MHEFRPFSATHGLILIGLLVAMLALIAARRRATPRLARQIDLALGLLNLVWWITASTLQLLPGRWDWARSLPVQVCDLSAIAAFLAMCFSFRWARALLYFVGIGLSSWALITPDLRDGPATAEFWIFFIGHGATTGAAVYDLAARGYRPGWGDFAIAVAGMAVWLAIVFPLNATFGWNYGYVGNSLAGTTNPIHFLGPWPLRVLVLAVAVMAFFALMTLPWRFGRNR